jgi:hypothetical protein
MTATTSELALSTAQDLDDTADYLTTALSNSLHTIDALFNNTTGHNHGSAHQGGAISTIPASAIPDGSITSLKIQDGSIQGVDLAPGIITSDKIAASTITGGNVAPETLTGSNIQDGTILAADLGPSAAYGNLANQAITNVQTQFFSAAMATSSASLVATLDGIAYTPTNPNGILMAFYQGTFNSNSNGSLLSCAVAWKGAIAQAQGIYLALTVGAFIQIHAVFANPGAGGNLTFYFGTNAGTVQAAPGLYRQLTLMEFKK